MARITVFTPAYNRAHTIGRTYESLLAQTNKDFIWMIIDDGSTDNTKELIDEWKKRDNGFLIEYYYKENGGMHTAHNLAYEKITTELNVCIDSDDAMPKDAIQIILDTWDKNTREDVAGIIALDSDFSGKVIGSNMPEGVDYATTSNLYAKYKATGDKKFIYRTDIIKSVPPYPEFKGEKLVPLGVKYQLISLKYTMILLDRIVCLVDYQENGSSNTIKKQYFESPRGFAASKIIEMKYNITFFGRTKATVHYIMDCLIAKDKDLLKNSPKKILTVLLFPVGYILKKHMEKTYNK